MKLPDGVFYGPRQQRFIAKDEPAIIRIETGPGFPRNAGYKINDRGFAKDIAPYLHGDWEDFDRLFGIERRPVVYSGAEHSGNPKLPNITVVPNLSTEEHRGLPRPLRVFGCTMGHYHPGTPLDYRIQEVYELQSYGMLVLDRENGEVELWVGQDGDKVAVPNRCHMTLYNLGDEDNPLVTLDFADPNRNVSDKSLARQWGPILLGYYDDLEVVFTLNRLYLNSPHHAAGVRLPGALKDDTQRQIKIARGGRLSVGSLLFENLTENPEVIGRFARLGLRIRRASPEAVLEPLPAGRGSRLYFRRPLVEATRVGTEVYRYFFPDTEEAKPGPRQGKGIAATEIEIAKKKENLVHLREKNGRLVIVVEGAGDWVEQTYRPLLRRAVKERGDLSVFWVDDTRWKPCPKWADSSEPDHDLQPWEIYLDKANPDDLAAYRQLLPDLVFIVTPDFTHSAIARRWLGRSPLVFVEKPFDSQLSNVYDLLREMGRQRGTAVLGLDHYQFYALPLHELKPEIERHLDRSLAKVVFHMTEKRPIELDRVRTLQYGLTLDMLPHFPAILTHFGDVGTIDEIRVVDARQYRPLIAASRDGVDQKDISDRFHNETYSRIRFTFRDYSGNGYNVPCVAVVGKGLSQDVKYLEATGRSGNAIRLDLNRRPESDPAPDYPWDSVFFLQGDQTPLFPRAQVREMPDPYNQRRTLRVLYDPTDPGCFCRTLERERYKKMIEDLQNGTRKAVPSTLSLTEALEIVRALDRIWWACQAAKPWKEYRLNGLDPVGSREDL